MTPDPIEIRLLTSSDRAVLDRVETDVFDNPVDPELAARYLANPNALLAVAVRDGIVVGMASALTYVHPDKPLQLFINEVGVSTKYQGMGLGKRLMHAVLEQGRTLGCTEAWVATEENNVAARKLYVAMEGTEDQDHAVVYTWKLTKPA